MPSERPRQRAQDILDNIAAIEGYVSGLDHDSFARDRKTRDAVERCLERISEAASKLGAIAEAMEPDLPWPRLRALGNVLRHGYDAVRSDLLWQNVVRDLPILRAACSQMIQRL